MSLVSISEGAKLVGKSRQTFYRYIKDGALSISNFPDGKHGVDTSELLRVFGEIQSKNASVSSVTECKHETLCDTDLVIFLKEQLERERNRADKAEIKIERLSAELLSTKNEITGLYKNILQAPVNEKKIGKTIWQRLFE